MLTTRSMASSPVVSTSVNGLSAELPIARTAHCRAEIPVAFLLDLARAPGTRLRGVEATLPTLRPAHAAELRSVEGSPIRQRDRLSCEQGRLIAHKRRVPRPALRLRSP